MKLNFRQLGLWLAVGFNLFLFAEYLFDHSNAKNVVLVFWIQSILAGLETVAKILFAKYNNPEEPDNLASLSHLMPKVFLAGFFTVHYGVFIMVLGIMAVFNDKLPGNLFQNHWVIPTVIIMGIVTLIDLPQKILQTRAKGTSPVILMFTPYIRLVPFVAIFFAGNFLKFPYLFPLFLFLKLGIDLFYFRWVDNPIETENTKPSAFF